MLNALAEINWWQATILIEVLVILIMTGVLIGVQRNFRKDKKKYNEIKKWKLVVTTEDTPDSHEAQKTYTSLIKRCKPERFEQPAKKALAIELFHEVSIHRENKAKLNQLKARIETELEVR
ncbi:hypothetical protein [Euzebyella saccharophila]|uniref:Uncharacterized protein n=1 Tax=Euzebyella saccharophila TaxID=679664 RepID=A0ABV8JNC3_9FLAO|nr:hypothetical protein [Euzebyella saccharophila]